MPSCALCKSTVGQLRSSHIVPSWMYKRIRDRSKDTKRPEPIAVSRNGEITQKSWQLRDRLLCERCELVFSERGEKYASKVSFQADGSCPLHVFLGHRASRNEPVLVDASGADVSKLTHFGAGVIWRAAVTSKVPNCHLPPRPRERLRRFLLTNTEFPTEMALYLYVLDQPRDVERRRDRVFTFPYSSPDATYHAFGGVGLCYVLNPYPVTEEERAASLPVSRKALATPWNHHPLEAMVRDMVMNAKRPHRSE